MLEVLNLTKRYRGISAVEDVSFTIQPGDVLGYLGPNGAGKSTTVKILIGLIEPTAGRVVFDGKDVKSDRIGFLRRVGYVPEEAHLYPQLSGLEYLQLAGRLRGLERRTLNRRIDDLLRLFALWEDRHSRLSSYSKGMRQKILLSAALLHDPDVLILDEPFSGLDVNSAVILRSLVRSLALRGRMIFYSSHVLEVVEKVCSSVIILRNGKVVANDQVAHLRDLMLQPSLEGVFAQLTEQENPADIVAGIITTIQN
jgi:ABC-2 type transport system ATP-binding protein